jgi:ribosomal-protein-alanine N-acetyltransferase
MNPTADNLHIRRMAACDVPRMMEIAESLSDAPHWPQAAYIAALNPESGTARIALVASEASEGAIFAFAVASLVPPQAELEMIAVAAENQRLGSASHLFEAMVEELRAGGVNEVLLEVRSSNHAALGFYRSVGFKETGRRLGYYADPIEDAAQMHLRLGESKPAQNKAASAPFQGTLPMPAANWPRR